MLYKKLQSLNHLTPLLIQSAIDELAERGEHNVVTGTIGYLAKPVEILNEYLTARGLPEARNCILFSRPGTIVQDIHIDCTSADNLELVNTALNFPWENCDNYMYWYQGDYNLVAKEYIGVDKFKRKYAVLDWLSEPTIIDRTIIDAPTLVKVSVPHSVENVPQHRKLLTFRFNNNPAYDAVLDAFSKLDNA